MKKQPALQPIDVGDSAARPAEGGTEQARGALSHDAVMRRLFAPSNNLPEGRNEQAVVVVSSGSERAVTHSRIEGLIAHVTDQLRERGIKEGDKVVFYSENSPELSSTILACWKLNAMAVLIDYRSKRPDVLTLAKRLGARLLVTSKKLFTNFAAAIEFFTEEDIDVLDVSQFVKCKNIAKTLQPDVDARAVHASDSQTFDLDRPVLAILTSGTTGTPKISVHTLRSIAENIIDVADATKLTHNMTALTPLPISHIFGLSVFLATQVLGVKTVLTELEPVGFVKAVHRYKPEVIAALPQFYGALISAPNGYIDLGNTDLLLCGGAPLTVSLADKFEEKFGKRLNNGYGSTECKIVALNKDGPVLSVGKPIGRVKVDIVNEQGNVLPEGKSGEVRISGSMLMTGYFDNEKESSKVLQSGHYYTGDIGRFEDGNLFIAGRKNDVVIVGGVVVQAGEIEEALRNNSEVKEVAVTAVPNKRLGQIVKASVVLMDDKVAEKLKSTDREVRVEAHREMQRQFRAFCKEHLSRYKRPMRWEFLGPHDNLPKTLAGKINKKDIVASDTVRADLTF